MKDKHFKNIKPNTQVQYSTTMKKIKRVGYDIPLNKVNANYILNLLEDLKKTLKPYAKRRCEIISKIPKTPV